MRKLFVVGMLAVGALGTASAAEAQGIIPVAAEVRGGAAFPSGDLENLGDPGTGVIYGVTGHLRFLPLIGVYASYERTQFDLEGEDADLTDDSFAAGGQVSLPIGMLTGFSPWVRAGALYNKLKISENGQSDDTDRQWGYELGGGVSIPLGMVLSVTPGVRYRSYSVGGEDAGGEDFDVSYFVADLGLKISL